MAWANVQSTGTTFSAATSTAPAFASGVTSGNFVFVTLVYNSTTVNVSSISMTNVTTWFMLANYRQGTTGPTTQIWGGKATAGGATTVTVTLSASASGGVTILEYSGGTLNLSCTQNWHGGGSSTTITVDTITPHDANTLTIGVLGINGTATISTNFGAPWSHATTQTSTVGNYTAWNIQTTLAAEAPTGGVISTSTTDYLWVVACLQASGTVTSAFAVQEVGNYINAGTSLTLAPLKPTAANALIAAVSLSGHAASSVTVSDGTNTWNRAGSVANGTTIEVEIWYAMNVSATSVSVQGSWTTAGNCTISVTEWQGLATASMLDVAGTGSTGTSTAPGSGTTGTTTNANDIIIGADALAASRNQTIAPTNSFGNTMGIVDGSACMLCGWHIVSATGSYSTAFGTLSISTAFAGLAAAFKLASAVTGYAHPHRYARRARIIVVRSNYRTTHYRRLITPVMLANMLSRPPHRAPRRALIVAKPIVKRRDRRIDAPLLWRARAHYIKKVVARPAPLKRRDRRAAAFIFARVRRFQRLRARQAVVARRPLRDRRATAFTFARVRRFQRLRARSVAVQRPLRRAPRIGTVILANVLANVRREMRRLNRPLPPNAPLRRRIARRIFQAIAPIVQGLPFNKPKFRGGMKGY